ncbi:TATA box-binding protein-associated factor RNA polymerase I subunit B [Drosophila tropicalis]|uniref:TATA box-binding protein-associated factor RNA polymerase I subunit B n=1 Tax=Drosophila tropicalis TaxID=46794 RepID=UPI0035ABF0C7
MDEANEVMEIDHMVCDICGERTFQELAGYYYCIECGTKKEQLAMAVEISAEDTFNDTSKHASSHAVKKKKPKSDDVDSDITSWEFYNYVLRGFLQELLNMGAKPELKLMTLQVWAAYMGRMEVAFCNNNDLGLPKLNVRVLARDARIIYNHKQAKRKRIRNQSKDASLVEDERTNWRHWRKTKRKLDASGYSNNDAPSESTSQANQSIKLQWSKNARKSLKCQMPLKHLDKHSVDSSGSMQCHGLRPKAKTLNHFDRNIYCLNITKLYVVLAIALNLVEDDIQLSDLLRFIDEEHITGRNVLGYLPEHVAVHGNALLKDIEFSQHMDKCRYKFIRMNIAQMSRFIDLNGFQKPNLNDLAQRYVYELSLPPMVASYVISLMDLMPPAFEPVFGLQTYPRYEARVMAYIVYVLKLLFGLDDVKERSISLSAQTINKQLVQAVSDEASSNNLLFVYTEWMEFVELRKVLVAHYNDSFAQRFGVNTQLGRQVDDMLNKERKEKDQEYNLNDTLTPALQRKQENICLIFETLLSQLYGESSKEIASKDHIEFQPTLTPAHSYFKRLLLHASRAEESERMSVKIPNYMYEEHSERQLAPFKNQTTELAERLTTHGFNLRVEELPCQQDYEKVGIFQTLLNKRRKPQESRANCDIEMEQWLAELSRKEKRPAFRFRQPTAKYGAQYQLRVQERAIRREKLEKNNPFWKVQATPTYILNLQNEHVSLNNLTSIQIFDETNMDPLKLPLEKPRRHLERSPNKSNAQDELLQPKVERNGEEHEEDASRQELVLNISNFDCWLLHGYMSKIRDTDKRELRVLFPCSFRWLLDICAATIGVPWDVLYEQLLVLEVMFHYGVEDLNNHNNLLRLKYNTMNKDLNLLTKTFGDMW